MAMTAVTVPPLLPLLVHILLLVQVVPVTPHARFLEPPSRASMWRMGFAAPVDYQDHEGNCGGLFYQWLANGGRCGICGDRWDDWPRPHERGGQFATGGIVRRYRRGQIISTVVEVTTAHRGYMEFRICELSRQQPEATQPCLNRHLLRLADGSGTKYRVGDKSEMARVKLRLPPDVTCDHCVIQWRYRTGNNWGICPDGSSQLGCGPQEEFRGCSDVAVLPRDTDSDSEFPTAVTGRPRAPLDLTAPSAGFSGIADLTAPSAPRGVLGSSGPNSLNSLTGPSAGDSRLPPGFSSPSPPSAPSGRPPSSRPSFSNGLSELTGPSSAQQLIRPRPPPSRDLTREVTGPSALAPDRRRPPTSAASAVSGYHHRPYEMMARRNRTSITTTTTGTGFDTGTVDDLDDGFIDLDDNFIDVDGTVVTDNTDGGGFIDSDDGFVHTDELEEVDLRELESLPGVGDLPPAFDGDNSIDDSTDGSLRSAGLRRGKQLVGRRPSDTSCRAVGVWISVPGMDAWCLTNCLAEPMPSCPEGMCRCGEDVAAAPVRDSLQVLRGTLPQTDPTSPPLPQLPSTVPVGSRDTVQALLTELAALRRERERLRYQAAHSGTGGGGLPISSQLTYLAPEDRPAAAAAVGAAAVASSGAVTSPRGPLRPFYFAPPTTEQTAELTEPPPAATGGGIERFPPPVVTGPSQDDLSPVTLRPALAATTITPGAAQEEAELLPNDLLERETQRGRLRRLERLRQEVRQRHRLEKLQQQKQEQQERESQQQRKKQQYLENMRQKQQQEERRQQQQEELRQEQERQQQQLQQQEEERQRQQEEERQQQLRLQQQQQQRQQLQSQSQTRPSDTDANGPQWETSVQCTAVVPWRFMSGVTKWCNDNCLGRARPSCPVTICACTNARVTISNPAVEAGRNRTLMQISHSAGRAKIVLNGVGDGAPGSDGSSGGAESNRSTTLYFKARAPGFLFFIQPIERGSDGTASAGVTTGGRPQSARAIVLPMGQPADRQRARQAAAAVLRRGRVDPLSASASTASPRVVPVKPRRTTVKVNANNISAGQRQQLEELYRSLSLLNAAGGRTGTTNTDSASVDSTGAEQAPSLNTDSTAPSAQAATSSASTSSSAGTGAGTAQRRSDSTGKRAKTSNCRGAGKFRHSFAMDYWCEVNCTSEKVRNCPKNLCECRGYARLQGV